MRVPILSKPVLRQRLHLNSVAVRERSCGISLSQDLPEGFPVDEGDITIEEDIELPLEFREGQVDLFSEMFEDGAVELM